tara:strand:- start:256 stop:573 length:318 start_codon:yes stop_codon:yes gene_type:complete
MPKQSKPKQSKPKQKTVKPVCRQVDTSCAKRTSAYSKPPDLNVEKDINKNKEVKESDVFDLPNKAVPKGSHKMPDGSVMKDKDMKTKKKGRRAKPQKKSPKKSNY